MRIAVLMEAIKNDRALKNIYLIGEDQAFGQAVLR